MNAAWDPWAMGSGRLGVIIQSNIPCINLNRTGDSSDLRKVENKKIIRETENVGFELHSLLIHLKIESRPK